MGAVFKRELKNYFNTSLGYIFIGLYLLFASVSFVMSIFLPNILQGQTVYYANLLDFLAWVGIFLIPILTMRLWPEEKNQKTDYLLLTSPNSLYKIVLGKYFAALVMFLIVTVITFVYAGLCIGFANSEVLNILINYIGFILLGASFIAIGLFASVITNNQVVAAIIGFVLCMGSLLLSSIASNFNNVVREVIIWLSIPIRFSSFLMGRLVIEDIVYLFTFSAVMIVIITKIIEMKRR